MRDCEHCKRRKVDSCGQLECQGFIPIPVITDEDKEIYKNAAKSLDYGRHPQNKHGSRRVAEAEDRIKQANSIQKPEKNKQFESEPVRKTFTVEPGMVLFFKNRFTGAIESGVVTARGWRHFVFRYNDKAVKLPYKCVGERLFTSTAEAKAKGKFTGP